MRPGRSSASTWVGRHTEADARDTGGRKPDELGGSNGAAVLRDNHLFFGDNNGELFGLDLATGAPTTSPPATAT
jgi:hypothetical protein